MSVANAALGRSRGAESPPAPRAPARTVQSELGTGSSRCVGTTIEVSMQYVPRIAVCLCVMAR